MGAVSTPNALAITRASPVLNYLDVRGALPAGRRQFVLWPAFAYRVTAPRAAERQLNVLQRAVLSMCRSGVRRAVDIGPQLGIHPGLAALILGQLIDAAYADRHGNPSDVGLHALRLDAEAADDLVAGFVFQDPFSGTLWPRFVEELRYAELEDRSGGFPRVMFGGTGDRRSEHAFMVLPGSDAIASLPEPHEILRASRTHERLARTSELLADEDEDDDPSSSFPAENVGDYTSARTTTAPPHLSRISVIDERPLPLLLTLALVAPRQSDDNELTSSWVAVDPFGLGVSPRLRRAVLRRAESSQHLRDVLTRLAPVSETVEVVLGTGVDSKGATLGDLLTVATQNATATVSQRLPNVAKASALFGRLVAMERAYREVVDAGEGCPPDKLDDVLLKAQKALERVFRLVIQRYDTRRRIQLPKDDREYTANLIEGLGVQLQFARPLPLSVPRQHPHEITSALREANGSLRALVAAAFVLVPHVPDHPLRKAARVPDLIRRIDAIAALRNKGGHDNDSPLAVTSETLGDHVETVYLTTELLAFPHVVPNAVN